MRVVASLSAFRPPAAGTAVAWGVFDGAHRGHAEIVSRAVAAARRIGGAAVVIPFRGHPAEVLHGKTVPRLTTEEQRLAMLAAWGVAVAIPLAFDARFAAMTHEAFVEDVLCGALAARAVVVGPDTRFGRDRAGDEAFLRARGAARGFSVEVAPAVWVGGERVSSTRVRRDVAAGNVADAALCLGRPYAVTGRVARGDGRGARLGFPTANLEDVPQMLPAAGVYAARAATAEGTFDAAVNVGVRPTFGGSSAPVVEAHLLGFSGDLSGRAVEVRFVARLRGETRFPDGSALAAQIGRDVEAARRALRAGP